MCADKQPLNHETFCKIARQVIAGEKVIRVSIPIPYDYTAEFELQYDGQLSSWFTCGVCVIPLNQTSLN